MICNVHEQRLQKHLEWRILRVCTDRHTTKVILQLLSSFGIRLHEGTELTFPIYVDFRTIAGCIQGLLY